MDWRLNLDELHELISDIQEMLFTKPSQENSLIDLRYEKLKEGKQKLNSRYLKCTERSGYYVEK